MSEPGIPRTLADALRNLINTCHDHDVLPAYHASTLQEMRDRADRMSHYIWHWAQFWGIEDWLSRPVNDLPLRPPE